MHVIGSEELLVEKSLKVERENSVDMYMPGVLNTVARLLLLLVLVFHQKFTETVDDYSPSYPPSLVLILSRLVHDMDRSTICYLVMPSSAPITI